MKIWREQTPLQFIGSIIWNTSETLNIPLGFMAPIVFGWMIGVKKNRVNKKKV